MVYPPVSRSRRWGFNALAARVSLGQPKKSAGHRQVLEGIHQLVEVGELPMKDQRCQQAPPRRRDRHRADPIAEE
jgi:hypothetical protein